MTTREPITVPGTDVVLYRKPTGKLFSGRVSSVAVGDHCWADNISMPWPGQESINKDQIPSGVGEGIWELWTVAGYDKDTGEELFIKSPLLSQRTGRNACVSFTQDVDRLFVYVGK